MNEKKKGNGVLWLIIVLLLIVIVVLPAILRNPVTDEQKDSPAESNGITVDADGLPAPTVSDPTEITEDLGIAVENRYMTYRYPSELGDVFTVRETEDENRHEAIFVADISERELELFRIILGTEAETGFELGVLEDETYGAVHVTTVMNEQQTEDWSDEDFDRISALQERINDIIPQFYADPRFEASR